MAIHASVKYRSLKAGVTHQRLQLTASIRKAAVAVSQKNVVASILSRQISPSFSFARLTAISSWQNLYLHDVHVNAESTIYAFGDSYAFLDAAVFVVDKSLSDSFGFLSESFFTVGKQLEDTVFFSDVASSHSHKGAADVFVFSHRLAFDANTLKQSEFAAIDQISVTRQPYNFVFSQSGGAVNVTGEPHDSFGFADSISSFSAAKSLQDFFSLDDFLLAEKDSEGAKSNVFGLTEYLESSFEKFIESELFGLADQASVALSKALLNPIIVEDLLTFHASKSAVDTSSISDAATLSPWIGKSDSTSIVDSLDFEHVVPSALLNQSMIGNIILNA